MHHPVTRLRKGLLAIDALNHIPQIALVIAGHTHKAHINRFGFIEATCGSTTITGRRVPAPSLLVHTLSHDGASLSLTVARWAFDRASHSFVSDPAGPLYEQ